MEHESSIFETHTSMVVGRLLQGLRLTSEGASIYFSANNEQFEPYTVIIEVIAPTCNVKKGDDFILMAMSSKFFCMLRSHASASQ